MALAYEDGRYLADGAEVTEAELIATRDEQIAVWEAELQQIAESELGVGETLQAIEFPVSRIESFASRFLAKAQDVLVSAYVWAAGGVDRVTDAGWQTVAGLVARQAAFGQGFIAALRSGELSAAQAVARSRLYAGAAVTAFEAGRAALVGVDDLPAMPGEGCEGGTNCRCFWSYDDDGAHWIAVGDTNTCAVCAGRAERWNPYVAEDQEAA